MSYELSKKYWTENCGYNGQRRGGNTPKMIVIHYWGVNGQKIDNVAKYLARTNGNTSAHYVLQENLVYQLMNENDCAWHAGLRTVNQTSIGIECRPEMTTGDLKTLAELIADIYKRWGVLPLVGHKDIVATSCPGNYYTKLKSIKEAALNIYNGTKTPEKTTSTKIAVDGKWGPATTKRLQKVLGTQQTGIITGQKAATKKYVTTYASAYWKFNGGGCVVIKKLQKKIGMSTANGVIEKSTVIALQKFLNKEIKASLTIDGECGPATTKALQKWLNK